MNRQSMCGLGLGLLLAGTAVVPSAHAAAKQKPVAKKKPAAHANVVKGQGQMAGGNGRFGIVYTLDNKFNFEILSARYTMDPLMAYSLKTAQADEKGIVLDVALKNALDKDNWFNDEGMMTLVDDKGHLYEHGSLALASKGSKSVDLSLRPGQGLGQPALKDPLQIGFIVPAKARIVKIMVNHGRLGQANEKVFRYYIAGATKEEAGEAGDPKNVIAPLAEAVRDPADPSGATALEEGKGTQGVYVPSGCFGLRLDSFAYSTDALQGDAPHEGKRWAIATVTAKNITDRKDSTFDLEGGNSPYYQLTDADGERYKVVKFLKARRDEDANHEFEPGDEYTLRLVFEIPKDAQGKKLTLATIDSRKWAYDVSSVK